MIHVAGLCKSFGDQIVLDEINLDIASGELVVVLGESGTGKSVLLKTMMGLIKPDRGSIKIDGQEITTLSEQKLLPIREKIGYLFQEGALYDFMTVYENIAFPLKEHTKLTSAQIREKVKNILGLVDLDGAEDKSTSQLSGGMKKRVGLARAVIMDSKILFCDEPTSGLDPIRSKDISDLIRNISKRLGCTTVITSHDIQQSFRIADRAILLRNGKVIASGTQDNLKALNDEFVQSFIAN